MFIAVLSFLYTAVVLNFNYFLILKKAHVLLEHSGGHSSPSWLANGGNPPEGAGGHSLDTEACSDLLGPLPQRPSPGEAEQK